MADQIACQLLEARQLVVCREWLDSVLSQVCCSSSAGKPADVAWELFLATDLKQTKCRSENFLLLQIESAHDVSSSVYSQREALEASRDARVIVPEEEPQEKTTNSLIRYVATDGARCFFVLFSTHKSVLDVGCKVLVPPQGLRWHLQETWLVVESDIFVLGGRFPELNSGAVQLERLREYELKERL